jgi:hypothetical protein
MRPGMLPCQDGNELANSRPFESVDRVLRYLVDLLRRDTAALAFELLLQSWQGIHDRLVPGIERCPVHRHSPFHLIATD